VIYVHITSQLLPRDQYVPWRAPTASAAAFATSIYTAATPGEYVLFNGTRSLQLSASISDQRWRYTRARQVKWIWWKAVANKIILVLAERV